MDIKCKQCDGEMVKKGKPRHSQALALILIIGSFFIMPFGVITLLIGLWMGCGYKKYWKCKECGYFFDT